MRLKQTIGIASNFLVGGFFIFSAIVKLFPIELFEYHLVATTFIGWKVASVLARLIIGIEFLLGITLFISYRNKQMVLCSIALLVVFSIYLVTVLIGGNPNADCGCMGSFLTLSPIQSLIKNSILIGLLSLSLMNPLEYKLKWPILELLFTFIILSFVFVVNPLALKSETKQVKNRSINYELDRLYSNLEEQGTPIQKIDLKQHQWVLACLDPTCSHCAIAAKKLKVLKSENPKLPIFILVLSEGKLSNKFVLENGIATLPYAIVEAPNFFSIAEYNLPAIYFINSARIERSESYFTLQQTEIEQWLK